jgi:hypothetical protein
VYEEVADFFRSAGVSDVVIASMDAAENDAPAPYKAKELPFIHLFPAGSKGGIRYLGPFSSEDIIDFIKSKAATAFDFDRSWIAPDAAPPSLDTDRQSPEMQEARILVDGQEDHEDLEVRGTQELEDSLISSENDEL